MTTEPTAAADHSGWPPGTPGIIPTELIDRLVAEIDASAAAESARRKAEAEAKAGATRPPAAPPPRGRNVRFRVGDNRVNRCRAYCRKVPLSVAGEYGHNRAFNVARLIWNDFGIDEAEGFPLLEEFNATWLPPLNDKDLRHKWDDAVEKGPGPEGRGFKLNENRPGYSPPPNGHAGATPPDGTAPAAEPEPPPNDEPNNPHRLAEGFLATVSPADGPPSYLLRSWRDGFWMYHGGAYALRPPGDFRADVTDWVRAEAVRSNRAALKAWEADPERDEDDPPKTFKVTTQLVGNVGNALSGMSLLPAEMESPAWIDGAAGPDPANLLAMPNGILDLSAVARNDPRCLMPTDHQFFTTNVAPFDFDPAAPPPASWLAFLRSIWPNDQESIDALQEWFGYLLTPDTRQQKILFLLGPKRSGKGTIARVLRALLGQANVAGPTLSSLASNFGLAPLLGKSVAVVSDARLSGRIDATVIVERLLAISGEDAISIDRKFLDAITTKLNTRFVILSNELPNLGDSSGALTGRLVILQIEESFYGKEDLGLLDRLVAELPGILLWAIEGWQRLQERGRFTQPASGEEVTADMEDIASPVGAFVRERCELGAGFQVPVTDLYAEWKKWCEDHGRDQPGIMETFGKALRAVAPRVKKARPRAEGSRAHTYIGIRLRPYSFDDETPHVETRGTRSGGWTDPEDELRGRRSWSNRDGF